MKFLSFVAILLLILSSCSTQRPEGGTEAEVLFKEAQALVDDGRYLLATEKLNTLRSKFPYSYFATHAELLLADVQFKQENYTEAAASYILFRDFHPKHEKSDYVLYMIAESFFNQLPETYDRDLTAADEAIRYFSELRRVFPKSSYTESAAEKINKSQKMLQDKEQYIADFYFKTKVYDAARFRYLDIIKNFKDQELISHSMVRVLLSSAELNDIESCKMYYNKYKPRLVEAKKSDFEAAFRDCQ